MQREYCASIMLFILTASLRAQATIQITSATEGTVVHPGDTVVTVSASGATFAEMIIFGEDPIGVSQILAVSPYEFSIQIPTSITPGLYSLTASGAISPGNGIESNPISIDIERPDQPSSISVEPTSLVLTVGERTGVRVIGTYSDDSTAVLTESTQTTYASQNPDIVTVSADGFATALAPGSTQITINNKFPVPITVDPSVSSTRPRLLLRLLKPDSSQPG